MTFFHFLWLCQWLPNPCTRHPIKTVKRLKELKHPIWNQVQDLDWKYTSTDFKHSFYKTNYLRKIWICIEKHNLRYVTKKLSQYRSACAYQEVQNVSFSKTFAYVLNEWSLLIFWVNHWKLGYIPLTIFTKKTPLQMFDRVANTPLTKSRISTRNSNWFWNNSMIANSGQLQAIVIDNRTSN